LPIPSLESRARATLLEEVFRRYLDARHEFNFLLERCTVKGWPDKKAALHVAIRLQELFLTREALRLSHLVQSSTVDVADWSSYTNMAMVHKRLEEDWNVREEEALRGSHPEYAALQREIESLQAVLDPVGLEGPFAMVRRDAEVIAAGWAFDRLVRSLERQLSL
jgi:hypothetical protein